MPEERKLPKYSQEVSPQPESFGVSEREQESGQDHDKEQGAIGAIEEQAQTELSASAVSAQKSLVAKTSITATTQSAAQMIEHILEEGLEEAYWQMPPRLQMKFKRRGEKTVKKIEALLHHVRVNTLKILQLIRTWLSLIPHVNTFFLIQESKIKTDKIVALHHREQRR